jgi:ABC-type transport system substrate-binding protein
MIHLLETGEFGLLNKVTRKDTIDRFLQELLPMGKHSMQNYPRIGLTFIVFTPDRPALQELDVRHAINHCLEKDNLVIDYCGYYGLEMDGLMGLGQWMYGLVTGTIPYPVEEGEEGYEEWQALSLDNLKKYPLDVDEANRLLDKAGWTLNTEGGEYRPGEDEIRCKMIDGELVAMDLTCAYPETNVTAAALEQMFIPHLAEAGIKLSLVAMDMKTLLKSYNDRDIEEIDMFYMGDDFNVEFDPTLFFLDGNGEVPEADNMEYIHDQMYQLADDMVRTEPQDVLGFMKKWIHFQEEFSDMLPIIPVYSNIYFDFYISQLQNYDILPKVTWGDAIVGATLGPVGAPEGEEDEYELEDDGDFEFEDEDELGEGEFFFDD